MTLGHMTLGQLIKKVRTEKDLSQPALADTIGIEQSYLSKLENDKSVPSNEIFRQLLSGLNLTLDDLLPKLDQHYVRSSLNQIPDIDHWLSQKSLSQNRFSRRILLISSALIVFATTFFYIGYSKVLFGTSEFIYISEGIVYPGEPYDYFEHGAYASTPPQLHDKIRKSMTERYDPKEIKTFTRQGESIITEVKDGTRRYMLRDREPVFRIENSILQILGVLLFSAGILGFVLERRFTQLEKNAV